MKRWGGRGQVEGKEEWCKHYHSPPCKKQADVHTDSDQQPLENQTPLPVFIAEHLFDQFVPLGNIESHDAVQAPPSKSLNAAGLANTFLVTNPNHSTILAVVKKTNFIPAKLSTGTKNWLCQFFHQNVRRRLLTEKLVIHGINKKITKVTLFPEVHGKIWFYYIAKIIPTIKTPYILYIFWPSSGQVKDSGLAIT